MSSKVARPGSINIKQLPEENPYELSPVAFDPDEVEMKGHPKFTPLPQDPPPAPVPRQRVAETDISTGISTEHDVGPGSPAYKNPPPYRGRSGHGQHFYEEVHHQSGMQKQLSKDSEYGSPPSSLAQSHSHTEADQAILFSQSTTSSLAPLTDTVERKPRKKVNPVYEGYRENGRAEKQSDLSLSVEEKEGSKPAGTVGCIGSVLRHPCTTFLLFLLLVGLVILFVLLLLGTISSKGGETAYQTQPGNASDEVVQLRKQVADQEKLISDMMAKINHLEMAISSPGSENASVTAKIAHNTLQIMNLQHNVTTLNRGISDLSTLADLAYVQSSQNIGTLAAYKNRIEALETHTRSLNTSVNVLKGNLQTHSMDINSINQKNQEQDNELTVLENEISIARQDFQMRLADYNDTIFQEIAAVRKMQGPRGYNGSDGAPGADLSQCTFTTASTGSGTSGVTDTSTITPAANEILTGVTCSTVGGERALLTATESNGINSFKCSCSGVYPADANIRYCYIHYWKCPA